MQPIKWLWSCADKQSHRRMICGLVISAITSLLLLVNPSLTAKLVDEVIVAQNPEPLLGILVDHAGGQAGPGGCCATP